MDHTLEELIAMYDGISSGSSEDGVDGNAYGEDAEEEGESEEYDDGGYAIGQMR